MPVKRALQVAEYALVGAMCVGGVAMALWNAGRWLLGY